MSDAKLWFGRKAVRGTIVLMILLAGGLAAFLTRQAEVDVAAENSLPVVQVTTAQQYAGESTINLIGTVRAFSEAAVTAESAGRVTSVQVGLGDQILAGSIIATLENAAEQAAVLSAQGSYEAALASAAQSNVGTAEAQTRIQSAQNNFVSNLKTAFTTVDGIINTNIDQFFSNPDGGIVGLKIDGSGYTSTLNSTRVSYQTILPTWRNRSAALTVNSDLEAEYQ